MCVFAYIKVYYINTLYIYINFTYGIAYGIAPRKPRLYKKVIPYIRVPVWGFTGARPVYISRTRKRQIKPIFHTRFLSDKTHPFMSDILPYFSAIFWRFLRTLTRRVALFREMSYSSIWLLNKSSIESTG